MLLVTDYRLLNAALLVAALLVAALLVAALYHLFYSIRII